MMNYEEFKKNITEDIKEYLPEEYRNAKISIASVSKIGMTYDSLTVRPEGRNVSPAANLNAFYEDYVDGKDFDDILKDVAEVLQIKSPENLKDASWILNYEQAKERLFFRVSNAKYNRDVLETAPHKINNDLMITCHLAVDISDQGIASTIVNNDLLEHYGITEKQLFNDAEKSAPRVMPVKIDAMFNFLARTMPEWAVREIEQEPDSAPSKQIFVVNSTIGVNGAAVLFYPGVLDQLAVKIGGDFIALPSSVHEFIVIPANDANFKALEEMVMDINLSSVDPKEQLSNYVYHYDAKEKLFERSDVYEKRVPPKHDEEHEVDDGPEP